MTGSWRERAGGLLSVNHPYGGQVSWIAPMKRRPPLLEVWHWSWLDTRWTMPLGWWRAWDPTAIPVGGSDWHRPGSDAPPGSPTTWVETEMLTPPRCSRRWQRAGPRSPPGARARCCFVLATSSSPVTLTARS